MIIVKINGGIGNQMFQYAAGKQLATKNFDELKLDTSELTHDKLRKFTLDVFKVDINIASKKEVRRIIGTQAPKKIQYILKKMGVNLFSDSKVFEKSFNYSQEIINLKNNIYLDGYWQSEKYFEKITDLIKTSYTLKDDLLKPIQTEITKIENSNSISVHVRRGDYINNKKTNIFHGLCSVDYYIQAINILKTKLNNPKFFIFSDDIEWCKKNLTFMDTDKTEYIFGYKDYEDLILMSKCKHNVIANSSFSWWGAWLNKNPEKIVIAPKKWFNNSDINTSDLIPNTWTKI